MLPFEMQVHRAVLLDGHEVPPPVAAEWCTPPDGGETIMGGGGSQVPFCTPQPPPPIFIFTHLRCPHHSASSAGGTSTLTLAALRAEPPS